MAEPVYHPRLWHLSRKGVAMGVASGTVMGPSRHLTASFTTLVGCMPATRLTSASLQNSTNCPGCRVVPSQVKVTILAP